MDELMKMLKEKALAYGAYRAEIIDVSQISTDASFRSLCESNACGNYGKSYMCPPDIGEIETLMKEIRSYQKAMVYQTVGSLEDSYDFEGMMEAGKRQNELAQKLRLLTRENADRMGETEVLHLGAGGCRVCEICGKKTGEPCRFPEKAIGSLEAYGINVSLLAQTAGMRYINGQNTVTYFGAVFCRTRPQGKKDGPDEITVTVNGEKRQARRGMLLGELLKQEDFSMPCAGMGRCGKCRVRAEGQLGDPGAAERERLSEEELEAHIRLACQTVILGPWTVEWETPKAMQIQVAQAAGEGHGVPLFQKLGAAVDLGTTTLAAQLYGEKGLLAQAGMENPQKVFGADVISRMEHSLAGEGEALKEAVCRGISELLETTAQQAGVRAEEIDTIVITGNTAMLYLLTGRNPECLSRAPFQADWLAGEWIPARELSLPCREARVYLPPCISAFVGADTTCAMLHTGSGNRQEPELLVDIGTNGEIVLCNRGELLCCSTAAGPAFEGAGLSCGMPAKEGAVSHVKWKNGVFQVEVIGEKAAVGLCGSGVIDAVSCLLRSGQMDETGYMEAGKAELTERVILLQEDIRKVQLAKSAICAGILTMLHRAELPADALSHILVAGGFGNYLNLESALAIGLLPEVEPKKILVCGNAALAGAAKLLWNGEKRTEAAGLAARAHTVNLAEDPFFQESYMEGMLFPEA